MSESKIREEDLSQSRVPRPPAVRLSPPVVKPRDHNIPQPARAVLTESEIRLKDTKESESTVQEEARKEGTNRRRVREPSERDELSRLSQIDPETPPRRAVSLRLTKEGRKLLHSQDYERGLSTLEKAIAVDSTNPLAYYYLGQAHYFLTHYQQSLNFLDVSESMLTAEPYWLARVFTLRGDNFRALGSFEEADASYSKALTLDPNNPVAFERVTEMKVELPLPSH